MSADDSDVHATRVFMRWQFSWFVVAGIFFSFFFALRRRHFNQENSCGADCVAAAAAAVTHISLRKCLFARTHTREHNSDRSWMKNFYFVEESLWHRRCRQVLVVCLRHSHPPTPSTDVANSMKTREKQSTQSTQQICYSAAAADRKYNLFARVYCVPGLRHAPSLARLLARSLCVCVKLAKVLIYTL